MIDDDVYTLLSTFGATSADTAPDDSAAPYIIYSASRVPGNYTDNSTPLEQIRFTIDVHHTTRLNADTLANSIKAALQAASFGGYVIGQQALYEPAVKLYRSVIDFEVFA